MRPPRLRFLPAVLALVGFLCPSFARAEEPAPPGAAAPRPSRAVLGEPTLGMPVEALAFGAVDARPRGFASLPPVGGESSASLARSVLEENDPLIAEALLADRGRMERLRAEDEALFRRVFARAAELKDLHALVVAGPIELRRGVLRSRACTFCLDPVLFGAWASRHLAYREPGVGMEVASAMWDWNVIPEAPRGWLRSQGLERGWSALRFNARHEHLRRWALAEKARLEGMVPRDRRSAERFSDRLLEIDGILTERETDALWTRLESVEVGLDQLESAEQRLAGGAPRPLRTLLAQARRAGDPAERLRLLSRFFDGIGDAPAALLAAAPPRADQRFDADTRRVVGSMLAAALMRETEGTWAGDDLREFYRRTPLQIEIAPGRSSALGWYRQGGDALYFNETFVEEFLKTRGASTADLVRGDGAMLRDLARTLVSTFVHEAQHHRQDVWLRETGTPRYYHRGEEVEAFQVQSLFMLQRLQDPAFAEFVAREGPRSTVIAETLAQAEQLRAQGPESFRWSLGYAHVGSNEARAWSTINVHDRGLDGLRSELARREALPAEERARLDAAAPLPDSFVDQAAYRQALSASGTASLRALLERRGEGAAAAPEVYLRVREREETLRRQTDERYARLMSAGGARRGEPPPPALAGPGGAP